MDLLQLNFCNYPMKIALSIKTKMGTVFFGSPCIQSRNFPPPPSLVENFIRIYPSVWATALPHTHTHTHNHRDAHTYIHTPSVPSQHIQSKWLNIKTCLQTITSWLPIKYLFFLIYQMCRIVLLLFSAWYLDKNS